MKEFEKTQVSDDIMKIVTEEKTSPLATLNPRDRENLGIMAYRHRKYKLGNESIDDPIDWLEDMLKINHLGRYNKERLNILEELFFRKYVVLRVYLYDHSGITISTQPFDCPEHSGQVGYIYTTKKRIRKAFGVKNVTQNVRKRVEAFLQIEVEEFDDYIGSKVCEYVIRDKMGEIIKTGYQLCSGDLCRNETIEGVTIDIQSKSENLGGQYERAS